MHDAHLGLTIELVGRLLHVGEVALLGDAKGRDELACLVILAPEDQSDQVDQEGMADQQRLEVVRLPATAGDHGLFESFGLDLGDLANLLLEPFPVVDGGSGERGVVLGAGLGQVVLELAGLVADHGFHVATEREPELARTEVEDAAAPFIEIAVGNDPVLQLGAGEVAIGGDRLHELPSLGLESFERDFLGDPVELHEGNVGPDRPQALEPEDGPLVLALAWPGANERGQLQCRVVGAEQAKGAHGPLFFGRSAFELPTLEECPGEGIQCGAIGVGLEGGDQRMSRAERALAQARQHSLDSAPRSACGHR